MTALAVVGISGTTGCQDADQNDNQDTRFEEILSQAKGQAPSTISTISDKDRSTLEAIEDAYGTKYTTRALTDGEARLLNMIFGEEIDVSDMRLVSYKKRTGNGSESGNVLSEADHVMIVTNPDFSSDDYSQSADIEKYTLFLKLGTHAARLQQGSHWEHSLGASKENFDLDPEPYPLFNGGFGHNRNTELGYEVNGGITFEHYGPKQQAEMVADYMGRFAHDAATGPGLADRFGQNRCGTENSLAHAIEERFPHLSNIRNMNWGRTTRQISDIEADFAKAIFGKNFDTDGIVIHHEKRDCTDVVASVHSDNDMYFWGEDDNRPDFAERVDNPTSETNYDIAVMGHELAHIWQNRTNYAHTGGRADGSPDQYNYSLNLKKWDFEDYNDEQQGAIIQDYIGVFLTTRGETFRMQWNDGELETLKALVEGQFPQAKKTREFYEDNGYLPFQTSPNKKRGFSFPFGG